MPYEADVRRARNQKCNLVVRALGEIKMIAITLTVLAAASMATSSVVQTPNPDGFELLILHNNDMHARFEQTSQLSGTCTVADRDAGKCYGGFPRVAYVVKEARKAAASGEGPPVLYLNAGDTYTGTAWFTIYKWKIAAEFINALQPDAVALGNNELQKGATELSPFLQNLQTTVLSSNVILNSAKESTLEKSTIINVNGVNVGIISYLSPEASVLDSIGNIEYVDEVIALREEVDKLKEQNVTVIIALGHSTTNKEVDIAKEVDGVDLVIAGHKNTYYWNGTNAETLVPETTVITQLSGKQIPIIYSYAYNQYLGQIRVKFDNAGEIVEYISEPILLDQTVSQDYETSNIVNKLNADIASKNEEVVGVTAVVLDGDSCSREECNLGNLVTDAIMYHYATRFDGERWTDAPIAIIQSGAIFSSVSPSNRPASVTYGDLLAAIPEESTVVAVTMTGEVLKQLLERSVGNYSINNPTGQFLQFSGIRAVYDLAREPGSRLVDAVVRCWACFVPEYYAIDDWRDYKILMPIALANGANGYSMLVGLPQEAYEFDEVTCTAEYIELRSPVYPEVAGRITLLNLDAIEEEITGPDLTPEVDPEVDPEVEPEVDPDFGPEPLPDSSIAISSTLSIIFVCAIRLILF